VARPKQWPPAIYHHKKSGRDRVRIDGKDVYLGPHGSREARAAYAKLLADVAEGRPVAGEEVAASAMEVDDVLAEWWAQAARKYSQRGREATNFRAALRPLSRLFGTTAASEFRSDQLEGLRLAMATGSWMTDAERGKAAGKSGRRPVGWCANVCNRACGRVKTVWRWAERKGYVPEGRWAHLCSLPPIAANDATARHTKARRAFEGPELEMVCRACPRPVAAMLRLQYLTGMRSGEVRIMRACDVDRSADVWVYAPFQHKNDWRGQERHVYLGPEAQAVLLPYLLEAESPAAFLFRPTIRRAKDHYGAETYAHAVRRAGIEAGVENFHPYLCRHAAKRRIAREMGLEAARVMLGQKSIQSAAGYDSGPDGKLAADVARKMS